MDESNGQLTAILIKVWGPSSSSRPGPTSAGEIDGGKWESVHYRPLLFRNLSTCKGQTCVERDPLATFGLLALAFSVHEEARGTRQESAARGSAMSSIHVIRTSVDVSSCPALFFPLCLSRRGQTGFHSKQSNFKRDPNPLTPSRASTTLFCCPHILSMFIRRKRGHVAWFWDPRT